MPFGTKFFRADVKQYIGLPSLAAIYKIYHSCIIELVRVSVSHAYYFYIGHTPFLFLQAGIISPAQQILELRHAYIDYGIVVCLM